MRAVAINVSIKSVDARNQVERRSLAITRKIMLVIGRMNNLPGYRKVDSMHAFAQRPKSTTENVTYMYTDCLAWRLHDLYTGQVTSVMTPCAIIPLE
jgi:hypothetical protein